MVLVAEGRDGDVGRRHCPVWLRTGLTLAFGETSGGFRRLIQNVFGLSIAFAASSCFLTFFQFGVGALV